MKPLLRDVAEPLRHRAGDHSQFGEGAIISTCLMRLGVTAGLAVEFGAGDGKHLSNIAHLVGAPGWAVRFIEADDRLFLALGDNYAGKRNVQIAHETVTPANVNDVVPPYAKVVTIDVDGIDYEILCAMQARPEVLVVEHHPMIPFHVDHYGGDGIGCSARTLVNWAEYHDYLPVAMTECNTIMVKAEYRDAFDDVELDPSHLFDPIHVTWALSHVRTGDYRMIGSWPFGRGDEVEG